MSYYKCVLLDSIDVIRILESLDEETRHLHKEECHLEAIGYNETRRRFIGQIRDQQTPDERQADVRRQLLGPANQQTTGPADDDS